MALADGMGAGRACARVGGTGGRLRSPAVVEQRRSEMEVLSGLEFGRGAGAKRAFVGGRLDVSLAAVGVRVRLRAAQSEQKVSDSDWIRPMTTRGVVFAVRCASLASCKALLPRLSLHVSSAIQKAYQATHCW